MRNQTPSLRSVARVRRGQSLIIALIALGFIAAISGVVLSSLFNEARDTGSWERRTAAHYLARAGLSVAEQRLLDDKAKTDALTDAWALPKGLQDVALGDGTFSAVQLGADGEAVYGAVDEERKLNVNKATRDMLLAVSPSVTEDLADAIIQARPFASLEELQTCGSVPPGFLGNPSEDAPGGMQALLTVYGDGKINVNTAPAPVLAAVPGLTPDAARKLVDARASADAPSGQVFKDVAEAEAVSGVDAAAFAEARKWLTTSSEHFTIAAQGQYGQDAQTRRRVREVVRRDGSKLVVLRFSQPH